jgi:type IV pilus assembly protein PilP
MNKLVVLLAVPFVLVACSSVEHEDIKEWMREQAKEMRGDVPPLPTLDVNPPVPYDSADLQSPFSNAKILTSEVATDKTAPAQDRPKQPLEGFPLEDLKVTGVIIDGKVPYALIQPPAPNKPKHVRIGEYVGQNFGRVIAITKDGMTVAETVKDSNGAWMEREVSKDILRGGGR